MIFLEFALDLVGTWKAREPKEALENCSQSGIVPLYVWNIKLAVLMGDV